MRDRYEERDVVRYSRGSKALGIERGDYARVEQMDAKANQVTVKTDDDRRLVMTRDGYKGSRSIERRSAPSPRAIECR